MWLAAGTWRQRRPWAVVEQMGDGVIAWQRRLSPGHAAPIGSEPIWTSRYPSTSHRPDVNPRIQLALPFPNQPPLVVAESRSPSAGSLPCPAPCDGLRQFQPAAVPMEPPCNAHMGEPLPECRTPPILSFVQRLFRGLDVRALLIEEA